MERGEHMAVMNPAHPGRIVRTMCLVPHGLTVTDAAQGFGVSRQAVNNLVTRKAAMRPDRAARLETGFGIKVEASTRRCAGLPAATSIFAAAPFRQK
jgi:antitoxin HigA-1